MDGIRPLDLAPTAPQLDRLRRGAWRPKGTSTTYTLARSVACSSGRKASDCGERPACVEDVHCERSARRNHRASPSGPAAAWQRDLLIST